MIKEIKKPIKIPLTTYKEGFETFFETSDGKQFTNLNAAKTYEEFYNEFKFEKINYNLENITITYKFYVNDKIKEMFNNNSDIIISYFTKFDLGLTISKYDINIKYILNQNNDNRWFYIGMTYDKYDDKDIRIYSENEIISLVKQEIENSELILKNLNNIYKELNTQSLF